MLAVMGVEAGGCRRHSHFEYGDHAIQSLRTVSAATLQVLRLRGLTSFLKTKLGKEKAHPREARDLAACP